VVLLAAPPAAILRRPRPHEIHVKKHLLALAVKNVADKNLADKSAR
jgi:hypothetical protein